MRSKGNILIVEDEELMQLTLSEELRREGYNCTIARDGEEGLKKFKESEFDIALVDLKLPRMSGLDLTAKVKALGIKTSIIIITAFGSIETAIKAIKLGAEEYITKPFLMEELFIVLEKVMDVRRMRAENIILHQELEDRYKLGHLIGRGQRMQDVFDLIEVVARGSSNVLIYGESGTGKELVAHAIHYHSPRKDKPFIKISCAALPETLLESELFGYEKGAFTGALQTKAGRFELANEGTLFLDDIDDMDPKVQVKLLRVLQEREFERLGGSETISVDIRLITASKENLAKLVKRGKFREDLYYRLNVISIEMPPLREKKEDIPILAKHFMEKYRDRARASVRSISPEAMALLLNYSWPGNIRELENVIERAMVLSRDDEIGVDDLPPLFRQEDEEKFKAESGWPPLAEVTRESERRYIRKVLAFTRGCKKEAAKILGISRKNLWEKLKGDRYGKGINY